MVDSEHLRQAGVDEATFYSALSSAEQEFSAIREMIGVIVDGYVGQTTSRKSPLPREARTSAIVYTLMSQVPANLIMLTAALLIDDLVEEKLKQ